MSRNYFWATLSFVLFTCCNIVSLFGVTEFKVSRSESLYGKGVHAFFDKDYEGAISLLTQAEQLGSEDPRPYYFLALSHFRLKQNDKADDYFKKAARFEWEGQSVRDYDVSGALRRIQGNERLHVERYRHQAKLDWQHAEKRKRDILYANEKANEKRILTEMAKHPVVMVPFGAQSIDPLGTGKKIEVQILEGSDSKPKKELPQINETTPSNSPENTNSDDKKNETDNMTTSDHSDNNSKKDENKEEESEDDPFK
jgi:tetratricopeptide (TPR) repeat protein